MNKIASNLYLELLCSIEYPKQEPEHSNAKWYDLFWILIPIVGILIFIEVIKNRNE